MDESAHGEHGRGRGSLELLLVLILAQLGEEVFDGAYLRRRLDVDSVAWKKIIFVLLINSVKF